MIHHSCDRCRRIIAQDEVRYEINLAIQPIIDQSDEYSGIDADRDHLSEIDGLLQAHDEDDQVADLFEPLGAIEPRRFDLCHDCCVIYARNPLGSEIQMQIGFSDN